MFYICSNLCCWKTPPRISSRHHLNPDSVFASRSFGGIVKRGVSFRCPAADVGEVVSANVISDLVGAISSDDA